MKLDWHRNVLPLYKRLCQNARFVELTNCQVISSDRCIFTSFKNQQNCCLGMNSCTRLYIADFHCRCSFCVIRDFPKMITCRWSIPATCCATMASWTRAWAWWPSSTSASASSATSSTARASRAASHSTSLPLTCKWRWFHDMRGIYFVQDQLCTAAAHQPVPKSKSTQPKLETFWVTM